MNSVGELVLVNVQRSTAAKQGMWVGFGDRTNSHKVYMHDSRRLLVSAEATFLSNRWGSGVQLQWEDSDTVPDDGLPSLPPLISASAARSSPDVEEVMGGEKDVTTPDSEPVPIKLKDHPPVLKSNVSVDDAYDGRPELTYQTVDRYESSASTNSVSGRGGDYDDSSASCIEFALMWLLQAIWRE